VKKASKRRAPKHWPDNLRGEFDTPIAIDRGSLKENDLEGHFDAILGKALLSKLAILADYYGVSIKSGEPPVLLALFLCNDLFRGFGLADDTTTTSKLVVRRYKEIGFALEVEAIKKETGLGALRACRELIKRKPAKYGAANPLSLKTRYMEARRKPIVMALVKMADEFGTSEE
jgi:hypothetical protein